MAAKKSKVDRATRGAAVYEAYLRSVITMQTFRDEIVATNAELGPFVTALVRAQATATNGGPVAKALVAVAGVRKKQNTKVKGKKTRTKKKKKPPTK